MAAPITLTIATGGLDDLKWFPHEVSKMVSMDIGSFIEQWAIVDLRTNMVKDPSTSVGHGCDFTDPWTVKVVMSQEGFTTTILQLVDIVAYGTDPSRLIFAHCRS